jgi:DNA-binding NtrC family response regulator
MPGLDGLTILRRAREGGLGTPVIVMTAHGDSNTAIEAMKSGAVDYVLKPLDIHQLLPQIERAIEHRRLAKELSSLGTQVATYGVAATMGWAHSDDAACLQTDRTVCGVSGQHRVLSESCPEGILADTAASAVCITSDLLVIRRESEMNR